MIRKSLLFRDKAVAAFGEILKGADIPGHFVYATRAKGKLEIGYKLTEATPRQATLIARQLTEDLNYLSAEVRAEPRSHYAMVSLTAPNTQYTLNKLKRLNRHYAPTGSLEESLPPALGR